MKNKINTNTQIITLPKLKKKKLKFNKKSLRYLILLAFIIVIGVTSAFYISSVAMVNNFKTSTYDVKLEEEFNGTFGTKKVSIVNNEDNTPVVLRINYLEVWSKLNEDGIYDTLSNKFNGSDVVTKEWTEEFKTNFTLRDDGWYYYNKVLEPGDRVEILKSITLNDELIQSSSNYENYKTYNYELTFNYEAIQATSEAISDIWELFVEIDIHR